MPLHIPFLGATWTISGALTLVGLMMLAVIAAFFIVPMVDCAKIKPSCDCSAGSISKECVCVCYKPHKDCTCQQQIDDINKRGQYIDHFVADRRDDLLQGRPRNWNPDLTISTGGDTGTGSPDAGTGTGTGTPRQVRVGSVSSKNIPVVLPEYAATFCEEVVKGLCVHEMSHITTTDTSGTCRDTWTWWTITLSPYLNKNVQDNYQDKSEFAAYQAETDYLRSRIMALQATCGAWKCRRTGVITNTSAECAASCPPASLGYPAPTCIKLDKNGKWSPSLVDFNFV